MIEELIYKLHIYPSGELEEFEQVQELVRCKECKHRTYCYGEVHMTNKRQTVNIHKDIDFCSYGEREGES